MATPGAQRLTAVLAAIGYTVAFESMLYGPSELGGMLWMNAPLAPLLVVVFVSSKAQTRQFFLVLLAGTLMFGLAGLALFVASPHDDYRFIILLLLPVYQFGIIAAVAGAAGLVRLIRRNRRS